MSYKLTYFNGPGRGEPARLLFAAAGVKFEDVRVTFEEWPKLKAAMGGGQMPVLEVRDKKLTQSKSIYRYLGRKFKLTGGDEWEAAQCDEFVDSLEDVYSQHSAFQFREPDAAKKEEKRKTFFTETLPTFLTKLEKLQVANGGTWFIGTNMTWADIVVAEWLRQLVESAGDPKLLDGYPQVNKVKEAVFSNPNIKAYKNSLKNNLQ